MKLLRHSKTQIPEEKKNLRLPPDNPTSFLPGHMGTPGSHCCLPRKGKICKKEKNE